MLYSTLQHKSIINFQQKQPTPFLATNQVPGDFRPILYEEGLTAQNSYKGQTEQPIETQSVQYFDEDDDQQYVPKQQQQAKQYRPIIAQQYNSQRLPEPQLHQYYRIEDQQHQRQKVEIQQQQLLQQEQLLQQQQQQQQHESILSQPIQVESSTTQSPRQEQISPNYGTYLQPQNFVQFIKSTSPKPVGKTVAYKIIRPTPKPPTHYVVYQHPEQEQEPQQPKQIYRIPADTDTTRNVVPDTNQIYHKAKNEYKQQSQQEPTPIFRIEAENKPTYRAKEL